MITLEEARKHWRDKTTDCSIAQQYRNCVLRWVWSQLHVRDHGRKYRFRILDRANKLLCRARDNCPICIEPVLWPGGWVAPSRLDRMKGKGLTG